MLLTWHAAAIISAVASDLRGASTFQWWMPSVSATMALVARSGFLVASETAVMAVQAKVVRSFGPLGTRAIFMSAFFGSLCVGVVKVVRCSTEEHGDLAGLCHLAEALLLDQWLPARRSRGCR